ncbi:rhamnogalacturonan lyase [Sorangium sp. So ce291]|uniref:rhamnogalacturonan lyase family protein n=1 Tax=Sorangium sp. So ce291 TaxID=3133294 RepID=UPI003F63B73C
MNYKFAYTLGRLLSLGLAGCVAAGDGFADVDSLSDALSVVRMEAEGQSWSISSGDRTETNAGDVKFRANQVGDFFKFSRSVEAGTYKIVLRYARRNVYGKYDVKVAGSTVASLDAYDSATGDRWTTATLGEKALSGNVEFSFQVTGRNSSASGYDLKVDYIELVPVEGAGSGGGGGSASTGGGGSASTGGGGSASTGGGGSGTGDPVESICGVKPGAATGHVAMENLCRGVVAVRSGEGNFISWRLMGYEDRGIGFNVYRDGTKVNGAPITNSTNYYDSGAPRNAKYIVRAVIDGAEQGDSANTRDGDSGAPTWERNYLTIPLRTPSGYEAGDASPGDLDGDGDYELVVKEQDTPRDPSQDGRTGQPKFAAYDTDGTFLWRIDLGINIRESEHTTPFVVYDLDGDGRAEIAVKTAPGTRDGKGEFLHTGPAASDDDRRDYRNGAGKILSGPEYLTVFSGVDGSELATIAYHAPYGSGSFGDNNGNRSDRYNATLAFLDDSGRPSVVMQRGYYARTTFGAYNYRDGRLSLMWSFDSSARGNGAYAGKGVHSVMAADTDGDLRQEIIPGGATIGPDGRGKCAVSFYAHGDALHIADLIPSRPGLEVFQPTEADGVPSYFLRDAETCEVLWRGANSDGEGPGRGAADDITPDNPGGEAWTNTAGLFNAANGRSIGARPREVNFLVWWDGDESRELLNGNTVANFDGEGRGFTAEGCTSINGTKSVPTLSADLFGDWREEVVFLCGNSLRIYTTNQVTERRIYTLMHDPQYRANVSAQNATYNQPPHTSFHIGGGMREPPRPNITVR